MCRHIFGLRWDVKDNVHYVDESTLVYPAGHNIVLHNLETKQQQFMPVPADSDGILGLALTPNRRYLAVTERAKKSTVTIYDLQTLKRRKVLASVDIGGKVSCQKYLQSDLLGGGVLDVNPKFAHYECMQEIASITFSSDSKLLAAQGGAPEWNLVIWSWEKSKVLASVKTSNASGSPINQVSTPLLDLSALHSRHRVSLLWHI